MVWNCKEKNFNKGKKIKRMRTILQKIIHHKFGLRDEIENQ